MHHVHLKIKTIHKQKNVFINKGENEKYPKESFFKTKQTLRGKEKMT